MVEYLKGCDEGEQYQFGSSTMSDDGMELVRKDSFYVGIGSSVTGTNSKSGMTMALCISRRRTIIDMLSFCHIWRKTIYIC